MKHRTLPHSLVSIAVLSVLLIVATASSRFFFAHNFTLRGIQVASIPIGGMTYDDAGTYLDNQYDGFLKRAVVISLADREVTTTLKDLGVNFDTYASLAEAYEISYGSGLWDHLRARLKSLFASIALQPEVTVDKDVYIQQIKRIFPEIRQPSDAEVRIESNGEISVASHTIGYEVDFEPSYQLVVSNVKNLKVPRVELSGKKLEPTYTFDQANDDATLMNALLDTPVSFTYDQGISPYKQVRKIDASWVNLKNKKVDFQKDSLKTYLETYVSPDVNVEPVHARIVSMGEGDNRYVKVEGKPKAGKRLNVEKTAQKAVEDFNNNAFDIPLVVETEEGKILNETSLNLGELTLLSQGRSNFARSPEGRDFNVRKGLSEKINNILIAPNETFSFNSYLGSVTYGNGWKGALAIFGGSRLAPVPGGGLCQVSTTVYRAALYAGLTIKEQFNHSLYVHYYKEYGDGLDSTVYPGQKDLRFENNTGNYILVQAYTDGDDAYVDFYGTPDGRSVELEGPFYANKVPDAYKDKVKVGRNQIVWIQKIIKADGTSEENQLVSTYRTTPR
ncbi:VanW family protein [Candidatus Peregrinibacteria bacterium]|nr:VanW family protein [Candidatus Peregrinibacteria bacterium]